MKTTNPTHNNRYQQEHQETNMNLRKLFDFGWIIAFLAFPPAGLLATAVIGKLETAPQGLLGGLIAGTIIGGAQMLALRRRYPISPLWIAATAGGLALGVALNVAIFGAENTLEATVTRAPLTGLLLGIAQWIVLRRYVDRAFWWIPAATLIYSIAWYVTGQVIGESLNEGFVVFGASGALLFQLSMGVVLGLLPERKR